MSRMPCPTREQVRTSVACPKCGAVIDEECITASGASRDSNHIERVKAAIAVLGQQVYR